MAKFADLDHLEIVSNTDPSDADNFKSEKPVIWINKRTGRKWKQAIKWIEVQRLDIGER